MSKKVRNIVSINTELVAKMQQIFREKNKPMPKQNYSVESAMEMVKLIYDSNKEYFLELNKTIV